jgi:arogenate/prephenate dehydratase
MLEQEKKYQFRVAYQGVPGAYSEMAACKACPDAEPVPCEQFEVAFQVSWAMDACSKPCINSSSKPWTIVFHMAQAQGPLCSYRLHAHIQGSHV